MKMGQLEDEDEDEDEARGGRTERSEGDEL